MLKLAANEILVLRTCHKDMHSCEDFYYPKRGLVEAPDWEATYECGHGLHGLPRGEGHGHLLNWSADAKWLVLRVLMTPSNYRAGKDGLRNKCKFHRARVIYAGDRKGATGLIRAHYPGCIIVGVILTGGDGSTLTGGYRSTLTGGNCSTLTGGYCSTLTGGDGSTLTGGNCSTLTGGYYSTLTGGDGSTLTGGDGSTLTGGDGSMLIFSHLDGARHRIIVAYVGENDIKPKVAYILDGSHKSVKVKKEA